MIERVNRLVNPNLQGGITLARTVGDSTQLRALSNLREYQLTLRNTSTVHLVDVEIQFEFPVEDVQEHSAVRTTLSKTALVKVETIQTDAISFPAVFRWRIPHLPAGDSVEFTFYAVNPPPEEYEVALYKSGSVIVEKVKGEPAPTKKPENWKLVGAVSVLFSVVILLLMMGSHFGVVGPITTLTVVKEAGCDLRILSTYNRYEQDSDIRIITHRIFNAGQDCVVRSNQLDPKGPITIGAGDTVTRERLSRSRPKLVQTEVYVGATSSTLQQTVIPLYAEP